MKRSLSPQTEAVLTALLADADNWRYGYDLSREASLKSGTLYPILIRLAEWGWLGHEWQQEGNEKPRHMYRLTREGRRAARLALKTAAANLRSLRPAREK